MAHVALDLNALAKGAQCVLVQTAKRGDYVLVGQPKVIGLLLYLVQAASDHLQQVTAFIQLLFQADHRQRIAQRLALQAAGVSLQCADKGAIALAEIQVISAIDLQSRFVLSHQHAAQQVRQGCVRHLTGSGYSIDQCCSFEYSPKSY